MASLFVVDIPEYQTIWESAVADTELEIRHAGPYVELRFEDELTIDRVTTGTRHAVWYSCIGALKDASVQQFDKVQLRVVADGAAAKPG
jgi:hypothetical protein